MTDRPLNWKLNLFVIWLTQIMCVAGFSLIIPFVPIYIRDTWGVTDQSVLGAWMAAFTFFGMLSYCVFTPVWGILADRYGRKLMLLRAYYLDGLIFPCFLLAPSPFWLIVARFVVSAFTGTVSAAQTLIVTTTPEKNQGFALGALSSAIWSGNLVGYAAGGLIVHRFGYTIAFLLCGAMYLAAGGLAHLFVRDDFQRPAPAPRRQRRLFDGVTPVVGLIFALIVLMAVARRFDDPYVAMMIEKIHGPENTALYTGWVSALAALAGFSRRWGSAGCATGSHPGGLCSRRF
ncbi:MAG: MFS transporter [Thermoguttaceae bacterium]|nr:MFS transporter [Thermoguttaceae bacterium]